MINRAPPQDRFEPKPTLYKGQTFRSRLEARWAYLFDLLDIQWQYEPKNFRVPIEYYFNKPFAHTANYLPDFFLPELQIWVEVKGNLEGMDDFDWKRLRCSCDFRADEEDGVNGTLTYIENSFLTNRGLVIVHDISPYFSEGNEVSRLYPVMQQCEHGVLGTTMKLTKKGFVCTVDPDSFGWEDFEIFYDNISVKNHVLSTFASFSNEPEESEVYVAYKKASSMNFQKGDVNTLKWFPASRSTSDISPQDLDNWL